MFAQILSSISTVSSSFTNQGAPSSFKFVITDKVETADCERSIFFLYDGKPKSGLLPGSLPIALDHAETVSVFVSVRKDSFAVNAMRKIISLRHPGILRVLDSAESDSAIYIATEHVKPHCPGNEIPVYGLYQLMKAARFVREDCKLVHGNLESSVFVTDAGSFKLGGFELARPMANLHNGIVEDKRVLQRRVFYPKNLAEIDFIGFMLLLGKPALGTPEQCEPSVMAEWLAKSSSSRSQFAFDLARLKQLVPEQFPLFKANEQIAVLQALETIHLKTESESVKFLDQLAVFISGKKSDPVRDFFPKLVLDLVLSVILSMSSLVSHAIPIIVEIGSVMDPLEFQKIVQPKLVPLFGVHDRSVRFKLLVGLPKIVSLLESKILESRIITDLLSGFTDSNGAIREQTMKTLAEIAPTFSQISIVEKKMIPNFIKLLRDPEASIRASAIVAISTTSALLEPEKREECLGACIVSGLKDPFSASKLGALNLLQTSWLFDSQKSVGEASTKFLPLVSVLLLDPNRPVREQAFVTITSLIEKIKQGAQNFFPTDREESAKAPAQQPSTVLSKKSSPVVSAWNSYNSSVASSYVAPPMDLLADISSSKQPKETEFWKDMAKKPVEDAEFDSFWADIAKPACNNNSLI